MTRKHRPVHAPQPDMISKVVSDANRDISRTARALHMSRRALEEGIKAAVEAFTVEVCIFFAVRLCWSVGAVGVAALLLHG